MGAIVSRFQSKSEDNYEQILSELDENIRQAEIRLREIRIRERNAVIILIVYSLIAYATYVIGYWYFVYMSTEEEGWDLLKLAPVFTGPFLIVIGYKFETLWYRRKETNEQTQLEQLKAKQKLKVEELKKKTGYYTTKDLVERYDSPNKEQRQQQQQQQQITFLSPGGVGPNGLRSGNMRQRSPHQKTSTPLRNNEVKSIDGNNDMNNMNNNNKIQNNNNMNNDNNPFYYNGNSPNSITPIQRKWYDKLVDVLVGEDEQKYALICQNCYTWNGLAYPTEFEDVQYFCKNCNHFNPSRRSQRNNGNNTNSNSNSKNNSDGIVGSGVTTSALIASIQLPENNNMNDLNNMDNGVSITSPSASESTTTQKRRGRSTTPKPMIRNDSLDIDGDSNNNNNHSHHNNGEVNNDIDYDDDGVTVSKILASRSSSRKSRSRNRQNRVGNNRNSDDDIKSYGHGEDDINREE